MTTDSEIRAGVRDRHDLAGSVSWTRQVKFHAPLLPVDSGSCGEPRAVLCYRGGDRYGCRYHHSQTRIRYVAENRSDDKQRLRSAVRLGI